MYLFAVTSFFFTISMFIRDDFDDFFFNIWRFIYLVGTILVPTKVTSILFPMTASVTFAAFANPVSPRHARTFWTAISFIVLSGYYTRALRLQIRLDERERESFADKY